MSSMAHLTPALGATSAPPAPESAAPGTPPVAPRPKFCVAGPLNNRTRLLAGDSYAQLYYRGESVGRVRASFKVREELQHRRLPIEETEAELLVVVDVRPAA